MEIERLAIPEIVLVKPRVFGDERGFFFESFSRRRFEADIGHAADFVQDNHSRSTRGVLRGIHYQLAPAAQGKLVRVTAGEVFDVAVDLRPGSPTFGRWVGAHLSAENKHQLWIPEGFGHAFLTLSETADFLYKATAYYAPERERSVRWDDPDLAIDWPLAAHEIVLSDKDRAAPRLGDAELFEPAAMETVSAR